MQAGNRFHNYKRAVRTAAMRFVRSLRNDVRLTVMRHDQELMHAARELAEAYVAEIRKTAIEWGCNSTCVNNTLAQEGMHIFETAHYEFSECDCPSPFTITGDTNFIP